MAIYVIFIIETQFCIIRQKQLGSALELGDNCIQIVILEVLETSSSLKCPKYQFVGSALKYKTQTGVTAIHQHRQIDDFDVGCTIHLSNVYKI